MIKQSVIFHAHNQTIPCTKYTEVFARQDKTCYYTIDLTNEQTMEKVLEVKLLTKAVFDSFAKELLAPIFRWAPELIRHNLNLVFIIPDEMPFTSEMLKMKEDLQYMRKLFLKPSEFSKLLLEKPKKEVCYAAFVGTKKYRLCNFNVVLDSSTKSGLNLLKELSETLKSSIFNIGYPTKESYISSIHSADQETLIYHYQKLWSMFQESSIPKDPFLLSSIEKRCLYLASILSNHPKNQPLLLDGIGWESLDDNHQLNMITTLNDFSEQSKGVIIACNSEANNDLVKKKVYHANFIVPK